MRRHNPFSGCAYAAFYAGVTLAITVYAAPETQPAGGSGDDATALYLQANAAIKVNSPGNTTMGTGYPPYSAEWRDLAASAWESNGQARRLARQARMVQRAVWPSDMAGLVFDIGHWRVVAMDLSDAAQYENLEGNDAEAIELVRDSLHMTELMEDKSINVLLIQLGGEGLDQMAIGRLEILTSNVALTINRRDTQRLQVKTARDLIAQLLDRPKPMDHLVGTFLASSRDSGLTEIQKQQIIEGFNRMQAESNFAAMSLACHVFKFDNGRWPNSLDELIPKYLPRAMVDPWGDGKQTLGYFVVKGGLPDGSDRPLVYSRCLSSDGMFYSINQPKYDFIGVEGINAPIREEKHGGQFRDVARWEPSASYVGPATRPLP